VTRWLVAKRPTAARRTAAQRPVGALPTAQRFTAERPAAEDPAVRRLGSTPCGCASRGPTACRLRLGGSCPSAPRLRILRPGGLRPNAPRPSIPRPDALRLSALWVRFPRLIGSRLNNLRLRILRSGGLAQRLAAAFPAGRRLSAQGPMAASGCASCGPEASRGPPAWRLRLGGSWLSAPRLRSSRGPTCAPMAVRPKASGGPSKETQRL